MFRSAVRSSICHTCRLHQAIAAKRVLRCKKDALAQAAPAATFHHSVGRPVRQRARIDRGPTRAADASLDDDEALAKTQPHRTADVWSYDAVDPFNDASIQDAVLRARQAYGDRLPDGLLNEEQGRAYERLYGRPLRPVEELEASGSSDLDGGSGTGTGVLKSQEGKWEEVVFEEAQSSEDNDDDIVDDIYASDFEGGIDDVLQARFDESDSESADDSDGIRAHPLTLANRFGPSPLTVHPPKETLLDPISALTAGISQTHITSAAHRIFGGFGLPDSTSTPIHGKVKQQRAIPLNVTQTRMSEIEADVYMSVLMPAVYASTLSVLVETRKRLGTAWAESLVRKAEAGQLRILDAGGAGMGVLAVRDLLKAEWERMHEAAGSGDESGALATADGKLGGVGVPPPLGNATVYVASDALRHRSSQILENTTFVPRMPDYVHTTEAKYSGKFDIILAPHTIWPIREDWARKTHVENLWSLLSADGGVLCMLEKGVARGFENIAAARRLLVEKRIAMPNSEGESIDLTYDDGNVEWQTSLSRDKEPGMIIAPCTNHEECPMYSGDKMGLIKGRKDICSFKQRYIRPPSLQRILGAKDKNFEDIRFSYLSVMRGRDLRATKDRAHDFANEPIARQGEAATDEAFAGYGEDAEQEAHISEPSSLSLPRAILPPIKRRGHVIMDFCTPAGQIERWTVPRSFSKQAFRDARKSAWGDLWALGAKTRVSKTVQLGKHARKEGKKVELSKKVKKAKRRVLERKQGSGGRPLRDF